MLINTDFIYPIGSVYMSVNSVDPSILFGGTWERITNTYGEVIESTNITQSIPAGSWTSTRKITLPPGTWLLQGNIWSAYSGQSCTLRFAGGAPETRQSMHCSDGNVYSANTVCTYTNTTTVTIYTQVWSAVARNLSSSTLFAYRLDGLSSAYYWWKRTA